MLTPGHGGKGLGAISTTTTLLFKAGGRDQQGLGDSQVGRGGLCAFRAQLP